MIRSPLVALSLGLGLGLGFAVACTSSADDGERGAADLSAAGDAGAPLTPVQAADKKLVGAWTAHGPGGTTALVISAAPSSGLDIDRATSMKDPQGVDPRDAFDHVSLGGAVLSADGKGGGTLKLTAFLFENEAETDRNEIYTFTLGGTAGAQTLDLTETSETFTKPPPGGSDAGDTVVDGGPITLRSKTTFTRVPSFCGGGDGSQCEDELKHGILTATLPEVCRGREDVCLTCGADNRCGVKVPTSCELARAVCAESFESCEFGEDDVGVTRGQVATVDADGNPIDCKGGPAGHSVCCQQLGEPQ